MLTYSSDLVDFMYVQRHIILFSYHYRMTQSTIEGQKLIFLVNMDSCGYFSVNGSYDNKWMKMFKNLQKFNYSSQNFQDCFLNLQVYRYEINSGHPVGFFRVVSKTMTIVTVGRSFQFSFQIVFCEGVVRTELVMCVEKLHMNFIDYFFNVQDWFVEQLSRAYARIISHPIWFTVFAFRWRIVAIFVRNTMLL